MEIASMGYFYSHKYGIFDEMSPFVFLFLNLKAESSFKSSRSSFEDTTT